MTKYIKYRLLSLEPFRISDDSSAKQGQAMTQRFIPGSTIRGLVVNKLAAREVFPEIRKKLLSDQVRFLNAYLTVFADGEIRELLPAPKGFYEDKSIPGEGQRKKLENIVTDGVVSEALKRAGIGTNVYFTFADAPEYSVEKNTVGCIHYYTPGVMANTKIHLKEQDIFRSSSVDAGYRFTGYIAIDDADMPLEVQSSGDSSTLAEIIRGVLQGTVVVGNARTSGLGKCQVEYCTLTEKRPYEDYAWLPDDSLDGGSKDEAFSGKAGKECYMFLLSDTVMRDRNGEYCGLDLASLEEMFGVTDLQIASCSTSVTEIRGFNRHYRGFVPSVTMYQKGSIFRLQYKGFLDRKHLEEVYRKGIGVRRNEGFGQILILDRYDLLRYKQKGVQEQWNAGTREAKQSDYRLHLGQGTAESESEGSQECYAGDQEVLYLVAKAHYRNMIRYAMQEYIVKKSPGMYSTASQLGNVLSIAMANRFNPEEAWKSIDAYYEHKKQKEGKLRVHGEQAKRYTRSNPLYEKVIQPIRDLPLYTLLEIPFRETASCTVMGLKADSLLTRKEEQGLRLELLINLIRYDFKKEVKA